MKRPRVERHHQLPKHSAKRQGLPPPRKTTLLTLPEHAFVHGRRHDNHGQNADQWAAKAIIKRMSCEELDQYMEMEREGKMW